MASFADLLTTKTLAQWKASIVNVASLVGLQTENWAEGGYTRTLVALFAQLLTTAGQVVQIIAAGGLLDTAEEDWLTLLAKNVFNVDRIVATYGSAPNALTLTNAGGGIFFYEAGDIIVAHASTGKTYRNTTGGTLGAGGTLVVDLAAEEAGSDSNAGVGTITVLVTTSLGVTCTNTVALVGLDEETDPALRQRCRDSIALLALGGIKRAYEFIAKSATRDDGTAIGVTRVRVGTPPGDGTVDVFVAGAAGAVPAPDVVDIQDAFDETVTPYGFDATAISATNLSVTAPCTIWIPSALGLSDADAKQLVFDALEAYVEALPIGGVIIPPSTAGKVHWRALLAVVAGSIAGSLKAQLTTETDIDVDPDEAPVWGGLLASTTVIQVATA
jgi:uncharacterized phage protein gp47/JayE